MTPAERDYAEAVRRIEAAKGGTTLALRGLYFLSDIPEGIKDLHELESLDLENCGMIEDLSCLVGLSSLARLNMSACRAITDLLPLASLPALAQLNISWCSAIKNYSPLASLSALAQLSFNGYNAITNLSPLAGLTNLTHLRIIGCESIYDLSPLAGLTALTQLDISGCSAVKDLSPIVGLSALSKLDISWCTLVTDLSPLAGLSALSQLDMVRCLSITDLSHVAGLLTLTQLNIGESRVINDLFPLASLPALAQLGIRNCLSIDDLSPLAELSTLKQLEIRECHAISDLTPLSGLSRLEELGISRCGSINDLSPLMGLSALSKMDLSRCTSITDLAPLTGLSALTELDIGECSALKDISPLAGLLALSKLDIRWCTLITDLSPLSGLSALEELNIKNCYAIRELSPLAGLPALSKLNISGCLAIASLEPLVELKHLERLSAEQLSTGNLIFPKQLARQGLFLELQGSLFVNLCDELIGPESKDASHSLTTHFAELTGQGGEELREVKLMLLGNGRAGKSSLVRALRGEPHQREEISTHGIRHWQWQPVVTLKGDEERGPQPVDVNIWDFGGQQIYHELHRLFMGTRAVFILLWNPWEEEWKLDPANPDHPADFKDDEYHPLDYWLDQIHAYSRLRKPQIILVRNFMDKDKAYEVKYERRAPNSWKDAVSARYRNAENIQYVEFSAADRTSALGRKRMGELRLALEYALNEQMRQLMSRYIPKGRYTLRQHLAGLVKQGPDGESDATDVRTMSYADFDSLVAQHCTVNGAHDTPKVLRFLHDIGALYYNERMPERVVLDQRWLVDAIYAMLKEPHTREALREQEGLFTMSDLIAWGWDRYTTEERTLFRDFMLACGVAIVFIVAARSASKEAVLLAPAFLPSEKARSIQRLLGTQLATSRREQAWTEHQWLGRDVALHVVAKAAEAFGNRGDYWRHGFLLRGSNDVLISMRWQATEKGSFGGRLVLDATGKAGAGKTTLMKEVINVLEGCRSFPKDARWSWVELPDTDGEPAPSAAPPFGPHDRSGSTGTGEPKAIADGFSKQARPSIEEHSPVWVGFSYKGSSANSTTVTKGQQVRDVLYSALQPRAKRAGLKLIDYQDPHSHGLPNTEALMKALSLYSTYSIALLDEGYWTSPDCMAELAMLYCAKPENEFSPDRQQLFHLARERSFLDPSSAEYKTTTEEMAHEARRILDNYSPASGEDMGDAFYAMAKDRRLYWHLVASKPSRLRTFNKAIREFQNEKDNPPIEDPAALARWATLWAGKIITELTGK